MVSKLLIRHASRSVPICIAGIVIQRLCLGNYKPDVNCAMEEDLSDLISEGIDYSHIPI